MALFNRRKFNQVLMSASSTVATCFSSVAAAQDEIMRIIVPFAPGGGGDVLGRLFADKLARTMGRTIIVENKPGANTTIGSNFVAKAKPDGNTILLNVPSLIQTYYTIPNLPYNPFTDFIPVVDLVTTPAWFAVDPKRTPVKSVAELVEWGRSNRGQLNYGMLGPGTTSHLFGNYLEKESGTDALGVPYKGSSEIAQALLAGDIRLAILDAVTLFPLAKDGKLKLIGVTGDGRSPLTPDVSTLQEQGLPSFRLQAWAAFFLPKGTPDEVVHRLHDASVKVMHLPEVEKRVRDLGYIPGGKSVADFQAQYQRERELQGELMRKALEKKK